ncbi:unnamed protein product [Cuscuta campestris]|uniref:Uncharacterized protein n=1 Tax=Cuscuta campestris TaxID=132261 RepID=A0A484LKU2_9ASTE|nr:unnamed protein product [Cuscuta campestris]
MFLRKLLICDIRRERIFAFLPDIWSNHMGNIIGKAYIWTFLTLATSQVLHRWLGRGWSTVVRGTVHGVDRLKLFRIANFLPRRRSTVFLITVDRLIISQRTVILPLGRSTVDIGTVHQVDCL